MEDSGEAQAINENNMITTKHNAHALKTVFLKKINLLSNLSKSLLFAKALSAEGLVLICQNIYKKHLFC